VQKFCLPPQHAPAQQHVALKSLHCSETSLTGESRFHIRKPPGGFEPVTLVAGSKQVSPLDQWDMVRIMWDCRLSTAPSRAWGRNTLQACLYSLNWQLAYSFIMLSTLETLQYQHGITWLILQHVAAKLGGLNWPDPCREVKRATLEHLLSLASSWQTGT
jgi:hypothetical protein